MSIISYTGQNPPVYWTPPGYLSVRSSRLDLTLNGGAKYTLKFSGQMPLCSSLTGTYYASGTIMYNPKFHGTITNVSY